MPHATTSPHSDKPKTPRAKNRSVTATPCFDDLPASAFIKESQLVRNPKHPEIAVLLQISSSTLHRYIKKGKFPKPFKPFGKTTAWLVKDVRQWIDEQIAKAVELR